MTLWQMEYSDCLELASISELFRQFGTKNSGRDKWNSQLLTNMAACHCAMVKARIKSSRGTMTYYTDSN